ncbi:MAG: hypothetical protein JW838_06015 [Spirochaetes bacterium]|nr:hypothetical protein [Spirochaetota bacterium]
MAAENDAATLTDGMVIEMRGRVCNRIYYMRNGRICSRRHVIPSNPRSKIQQAGRSQFALLVKRWRELDGNQRVRWNRRAGGLNMSGYNLFISHNMKKFPVSKRKAILINPPGSRRVKAARQAARVITCGPLPLPVPSLPRARGRDPGISRPVPLPAQPYLPCHATRHHHS